MLTEDTTALYYQSAYRVHHGAVLRRVARDLHVSPRGRASPTEARFVSVSRWTQGPILMSTGHGGSRDRKRSLGVQTWQKRVDILSSVIMTKSEWADYAAVQA